MVLLRLKLYTVVTRRCVPLAKLVLAPYQPTTTHHPYPPTIVLWANCHEGGGQILIWFLKRIFAKTGGQIFIWFLIYFITDHNEWFEKNRSRRARGCIWISSIYVVYRDLGLTRRRTFIRPDNIIIKINIKNCDGGWVN